MKKIMTILLALVLVLGMSVSAFATVLVATGTNATDAPAVTNVQVTPTEEAIYTDSTVNVSGTATVKRNWTLVDVKVEGELADTNLVNGNFSKDLVTPEDAGTWEVDITVTATNNGGQTKTFTYAPVEVQVIERPVAEEGIRLEGQFVAHPKTGKMELVITGVIVDGVAIDFDTTKIGNVDNKEDRKFDIMINGEMVQFSVSELGYLR